MAVQPNSDGVSVDPTLQLVIAAENALAATWQRGPTPLRAVESTPYEAKAA